MKLLQNGNSLDQYNSLILPPATKAADGYIKQNLNSNL